MVVVEIADICCFTTYFGLNVVKHEMHQNLSKIYFEGVFAPDTKTTKNVQKLRNRRIWAILRCAKNYEKSPKSVKMATHRAYFSAGFLLGFYRNPIGINRPGLMCKPSCACCESQGLTTAHVCEKVGGVAKWGT